MRLSDIPSALFTPHTPTRVRGVYQFGKRFYVKIKANGRVWRLGAKRSLREAVQTVVNWYRERYGPHWEAVASARESNPWKIVRAKRGPASGRFLVIVWLFGQRTRIDPPLAIGWPTYADANEARPLAVAAFLRAEFLRRGLPFHYLETHPVLWRIAGRSTPPAPPPGSVWWAPAVPPLPPLDPSPSDTSPLGAHTDAPENATALGRDPRPRALGAGWVRPSPRRNPHRCLA